MNRTTLPKALPHSTEAEEAVLGSLLIDPSMYLDVASVLTAEDFYHERSRQIYKALQALQERELIVDIVVLQAELEQRGLLQKIGGLAYLTKLLNATSSAAYAGHYAGIVHDQALRRAYIAVSTQLARDAYGDTALEDIQSRLDRALLAVQRGGGGETKAEVLAQQVCERVTYWSENPLAKGQTRYLATGIRPLDRALGGLEAGLYLLAARPSMGKTALVLQIAANVAQRGERVLLWTLEQSPEQLALRMACSQACVVQDEVKRGVALQEGYFRLLEQLDKMRSWPLSIYFQSGLRANMIHSEVAKRLRQEDVALVIVDGLWLMTAGTSQETRSLELGSISRDLLLAAKELQVPLLAVHQLSRGVEQRADKRPMLSDLRESGRLEEDADVVLMLYREGYYDHRAPDANVAEVWIRKNRLGGPADRLVKLHWQGKHTRFEELVRVSLE